MNAHIVFLIFKINLEVMELPELLRILIILKRVSIQIKVLKVLEVPELLTNLKISKSAL